MLSVSDVTDIIRNFEQMIYSKWLTDNECKFLADVGASKRLKGLFRFAEELDLNIDPPRFPWHRNPSQLEVRHLRNQPTSNSPGIKFSVRVQNGVLNALSFLNVVLKCSLLRFKMTSPLEDLIILYFNLVGFILFFISSLALCFNIISKGEQCWFILSSHRSQFARMSGWGLESARSPWQL